MTKASALTPGQWIILANGVYLVDAVAVRDGIAYIGTKHGVATMPANDLVLVGG